MTQAWFSFPPVSTFDWAVVLVGGVLLGSWLVTNFLPSNTESLLLRLRAQMGLKAIPENPS